MRTPKHNLPLGFLGTFILAFGWLGFNAGSTNEGIAHIAVIAVNTMLASASGATMGIIVSWIMMKDQAGRRWFSLIYMCNGMLGGLVAITAPCAFVPSWAAVLIGLIAGAAVVIFSWLIEDEWRWVDDPVGAISVHGVCGIWGMLALGLFSNGSYGAGVNGVSGKVEGGVGQFLVQCLGVLMCILITTGLCLVCFWLIRVILWSVMWVTGRRNSAGRFGAKPERPDPNAENAGLDVSEFGIEDAYSSKKDLY